MKDFIRDPFVQRVTLTLLCGGAFILATVFPQVRTELTGLAGMLFGWAQLTKPGSVSAATVDAAVKAAVKVESLRPAPPTMFPPELQ